MTTEPDINSTQGLFEEPSPATLATYRRDGSAALSPVWFRVNDGFLEVVLAENDVKLRHLAANPACALLVFEAEPPFRGVRVEGSPELSRGDVSAVRTAIATRYLGAADGARFAASRSPAGTVLRLPVAAAKTWDLAASLPEPASMPEPASLPGPTPLPEPASSLAAVPDATDPEIVAALAELPDWRIDFPGIAATFATGSFSRGVALVDAIGALADAADHHPDIELGYPRVTVRLVTHDAGSRVTKLDTALAATISAAAAKLGIGSVGS